MAGTRESEEEAEKERLCWEKSNNNNAAWCTSYSLPRHAALLEPPTIAEPPHVTCSAYPRTDVLAVMCLISILSYLIYSISLFSLLSLSLSLCPRAGMSLFLLSGLCLSMSVYRISQHSEDVSVLISTSSIQLNSQIPGPS